MSPGSKEGPSKVKVTLQKSMTGPRYAETHPRQSLQRWLYLLVSLPLYAPAKTIRGKLLLPARAGRDGCGTRRRPSTREQGLG